MPATGCILTSWHRTIKMEYIITPASNIIDFHSYQKYLLSIKDRLPAHVYTFASDEKYFDLRSPTSLHDAWLETCTIKESGTGNRNQIRMLEVHISLLGQFHDRRIHLSYRGVNSYSFKNQHGGDSSVGKEKNHGDLYTHEIRLSPDGLLIHELLFERGTFLIEFEEFQHSEELVTA